MKQIFHKCRTNRKMTKWIEALSPHDWFQVEATTVDETCSCFVKSSKNYEDSDEAANS